jgi:DNA-binding NarL/FixJ family response regulator
MQKSSGMLSNNKTGVLIVDDHAVVRMGLSRIINKARDFEVRGESADGAPVLEMIATLKPDVLVLDLMLKDTDGLELLKEIHAKYPALPILVLSMNEAMVYAERALRAGALGYVHKDQATENVVLALREILAGNIYAADNVKAKLLRKITRSKEPGKGDPVVDVLSDRELDVFRLLGEGFTTKAISEKWRRSIKTVETYRANIKRKLNLENSAQLIREAVEWTKTSR